MPAYIVSDAHFGFTHFTDGYKRDMNLAKLLEDRIEQMGITHRIYRAGEKVLYRTAGPISYADLPEGAKGPPTTNHRIIHVGDFI